MKLSEKIDLIKEHKTDTLAALGAYITHVYDISNPFYTKEGVLIQDYSDDKVNLQTDKDLVNFITSFRSHVKEFEIIEDKLKKEDFNLSLLEVNRIALVFEYMKEVFKKQLLQTQTAISECEKIYDQLVSPDK